MSATNISSDRPINSFEEDRYGLERHFIPRLVRIALEWPSKDGLVIGLFGPWGIGKTSVFNMFRSLVERKRDQYSNVRIASFNPWFYEDTGALVTSFFATIATELDEGSKPWNKAAAALKAMGTFLTVASKGVSLFGINMDVGAAKEAVDAGVKTFKEVSEFSSGLAGLAELADGGQKKFDQYRATVERALASFGELKGRVVILVDDIDRLNKVELLSLLRLVRTVADLPYITLLLAMDDSRIRDILSDAVSEGYGKGYLDKIIQAPLHVPLPTREEILSELTAQLTSAFGARGLPLPAELTHDSSSNQHELLLLASLIQTPRDMKRYVNGIRILLLSGDDPDIDPTDAALIEALHIFYPDVYDRVRRHKHFLTDSPGSRMSVVKAARANDDDARGARTAELDLIIHGGTKSLDETTELSVRDLIRCLFGDVEEPELRRNHVFDTATRRISSPTTFDNYFRCAPPLGVIRRSEMDSYFARILKHVQNVSSIGVADVLVEAFVGRDDNAKMLLVQDLGHRLSLPIDPEDMGLIGEGVLEASVRLAPADITALLANVLSATLQFQFRDSGEWTEKIAHDLAAKLLQRAICSQLPVVMAYRLLQLVRRPMEMPGAEGDFKEVQTTWIKRIDKEIREGDFLAGAGEDSSDAADIFWSTWEMLETSATDSPVSQEEFSTHLTEYVLLHPERLPQALYLFSSVKSPGYVCTLIHSRQSKKVVIQKLEEVFGGHKRLRPAYDAFLGNKLDAGRYSRLLEDFATLFD